LSDVVHPSLPPLACVAARIRSSTMPFIGGEGENMNGKGTRD